MSTTIKVERIGDLIFTTITEADGTRTIFGLRDTAAHEYAALLLTAKDKLGELLTEVP